MTGARLDASLGDPTAYRFWTPVRIRFQDLDLLGHVNNVALAAWLEDGRTAFEVPVQPLVPDYGGPVIVLADLRIQYLAEVQYGDAVRVGTRIERLGRSSVVLGQAIFVGDRPAVVATAVEVLIGAASRQPEPWPEPFREYFARWLRPAPPAE